MKTCEKIDARLTDFEQILICALRYALGRRTYIVTLTADYTKERLPELSEKALGIIADDIEKRRAAGVLDRYALGDPLIDRPVWMQLLSSVKLELGRRI